MSVPRWLRTSCLGSVAVAALFLIPLSLLGPAGAQGTGGVAPGDDPCPGAPILNTYLGSLSSEGGSLPAGDLSGVAIQFSFSYQTTFVNQSTGAVVAVSCTAVLNSVLTDTNGSFPLELRLPSPGCDLRTGICETMSGPFGPFSVAPALEPPAGYETKTTVHGSSVAMVFVAELASVALAPSGPVVGYSPSAVETVVAWPLAGDGSPTPGTPGYTWSLTGSGWRFVGTPDGPEASLTAANDAGLGTISVVAHLTVGTTTFFAGPTNLSLEAVPTAVVAASESRTEVDVGGAVALTLTASGAPGYDYTGVVLPGLGLSSRPLACSPVSSDATTEVLRCSANLTYPDPGVGTPEVVVSNRYSSASELLAPVTVNPAPALEVTPGSPLAYAGEPVSLRVTALPGTGTGPYRQACLDPGDGPTLCQGTAGPSWTFEPVYASSGTYLGTASTWDASGANGSLPVTVTIAPPLDLGSVSAGAPAVSAGEATNVSANLSGGFLPARYWWNVSGAPGSIGTGAALNDGSLGAEWVPASPGSVSLSLTVVDSLGTAVERSIVVEVGADLATSVAAVDLPPADPVMAGTPVGIAWQAFDNAGAPAVAFSAVAELWLTGPDGAAPSLAWVNVSGIGPLPAVSPGVFGVPQGAWTLGRLNLSVTAGVSGTWTFQLTSLGGLSPPAPLVVYVGADLAHLHLYDPEVLLAGSRTNRTFWHLEDRFGNPAPGTSVEVDVSSVNFSEDSLAPVLTGPGGTSGVWVNYSAPSSAAGSVEVWTPLSGILLGPLPIPAAPSPGRGENPLDPLLVGLPVAAAALGAVGWTVRRRRPATPAPREPLTEAELRQFVEGRDRVIAAVGEAGVADLARIEAAWSGSTLPAQLSDWVASLVADGTLGARTGPDGVARFCLTGPALGAAHIILDDAALARATRARDALVEEADREPGLSGELP